MIGLRFSLLTVVSFVGLDYRNQKTWLCVCMCGQIKLATTGTLNAGRAKSCGCLRSLGNTKHHHKQDGVESRTYNSWRAMRQRCSNPKSDHYAYYGALGVTVCAAWRDFRNFLTDMGERPLGMTIDRNDPTGNYEPNNCQWATDSQQRQNKRIRRIQCR